MNKRTRHLSDTAFSILTAAGMTLSAAAPVFAAEPEETTQPAPVAEPAPAAEASAPAESQPVQASSENTGETAPAENQPDTAKPADSNTETEQPQTSAAPETEQPAEPAAEPSATPAEKSEQPEEPAEEAEQEEEKKTETISEDEETPEVVMALQETTAESVSASLEGMVSSVADQTIDVQANDASKAGKDTDYTGKAVLDLKIPELLANAKAQYDDVIGLWPNAKQWPIEGPNHTPAVITVNVALPDSTNAEFTGSGTSSIQSPLISSVSVAPNGKTAAVTLTLKSMSYDSFFSQLEGAGTVHVEIPYAGSVTQGDNLDGLHVTASGSGELSHMTGFGFPITVDIALNQGTAGEFFAKGEPYKYVAGVVDETIALNSSLQLNNEPAGKVTDMTVGDQFTLTGTLDVSPIKQTLTEKIDKYKDLISQVSGVSIENLSTTFTAHMTLPKGVSWNGSAADASFEGSDMFEIKSATKAGDGVDVVMGLKDPASVTNLQQLSDTATAGSDQFVMKLNGLTVEDDIERNVPQTITSDVTGEFKALATFENGAQYDITYHFVTSDSSAEASQVQLRVLEAIPMKETVEVPATLSAGDADPGEEYRTQTEKPFSITGSIGVQNIKDKMNEIIQNYDHASEDPASIPVSDADVSFDAVFTIPDGVSYDNAGKAEFSGSSDFKLDSLKQDSNTLTAHLVLNDSVKVENLQDLIDIASASGNDLSLTIDGFTVDEGAENFEQFTFNASLNGTLKANAVSSTGYLFDMDFTFKGTPDPKAVVVALVAQQVKETVEVPAHLSAGDAEEGKPYSTLPETPFVMTGSLDVTPIKEKMESLVNGHEHASDDPASLPVNSADVEFEAVYHLPEGVSWKEGSSAEFNGSSDFVLKSLTKNGQDVTAVLTLKDPSSVKTVADLIAIAENSDDMLTLKTDGFTVDAGAKRDQVFTASAEISGYMKAEAESSLGIPFEFDFEFKGANEPTAEIIALQAQTITGNIPVSVSAGAGEEKADHYTAEAGSEFPITEKLDLAGLKSEMSSLMDKMEKPGENPEDIPVTDPDLTFNAFFALPEGIDWKEGSTAELLGSDDFRIVSVEKDGNGVRAVIALKDPSSVKNLADLMKVASEAEDTLELKVNGFSTNDKLESGKAVQIPVSVSGSLSADATDAENAPVVIRYTISSNEGSVSIDVKKKETPSTPETSEKPSRPEKPSETGKPSGKPAQSVKPTQSSASSVKKTPSTAANAQASLFAGALSLSAIGAALLSLFKKNRKDED